MFDSIVISQKDYLLNLTGECYILLWPILQREQPDGHEAELWISM